MKIVTARRISQIFFFLLFVYFGIVSTVGGKFWQIRGWPVNWFLQLDPLVAIGTLLTTHKLYAPLLWALATIILTIIVGRFFCGWVCPFGTIHHFVGYLGKRRKSATEKIELNKYRSGQRIKYYILTAFLFMAAFPSLAVSLQVGLLDPIPLVTRTLNLVILPIADKGGHIISASNRFYEGAWLIFAIFLGAVSLNVFIPRFYCRFICPLGALFGIINRFAIWRIGKNTADCINCGLCEQSCEGGCEPSGNIRISECILCFNCLDECREGVLSYQTAPSEAGEITGPDVSRRGFVLSLASGILAVPAVRLGNRLGRNWYYKLIRPPGALEENEFLKRCIKCGQCMRVCPTNVIQPGGMAGGLENLWTPVLNNRIGSSGCQLNCVACGQVCPSSAIRAISLEEKLGSGKFADVGPIKLGTAFVDHSRCLPWSANKPCIVCEENCPLSPKAIYTREFFETVRDGVLTVGKTSGTILETVETNLTPGQFATGDYYCSAGAGRVLKIAANTEKTIELDADSPLNEIPADGAQIEVQVRLQKPFVDVEKCIGCGVCEHECPVSGKRGIRVSAEGETRSSNKALLINR